MTETDLEPRAAEMAARIGLAIDAAGGATVVQERSGVSRTAMYSWKSGRTLPNAFDLARFCAAAGVLPNWVLFGWPPMSIGDESGDPFPIVDLQRYCEVPVYDVSVSAGSGAFAEQLPAEDYLWFRRDFIKVRLGADESQLACVNVVGDSMEPELRDGDVVMVNRAETEQRDGIYVVDFDGVTMVKRLRRAGQQKVVLASTNQAYPPVEVDLAQSGELLIIRGRVVWIGRTL